MKGETRMNDLELNAIADGIYEYLSEKTETPTAGLSVLVIAICIMYHKTNDGKKSFQDFADSFCTVLLGTYASVSATGTEKMQ